MWEVRWSRLILGRSKLEILLKHSAFRSSISLFSPPPMYLCPTLGLSIRDSSGQHLFKLRKSLLPGQGRGGGGLTLFAAGGDGSSARSSWSGLLLRLSPPPVTPTESNKKKTGGYFWNGKKMLPLYDSAFSPPPLAGNNDCTTAVILKGHPRFFALIPNVLIYVCDSLQATTVYAA